jgi:hypothetical protein
MSILLTADQAKLVETKRRKPAQRPQYYNAELKQKVPITEDFEAFLILLGRDRSSATLKWINQSGEFSGDDADRDALVAAAIDKDTSDADNKYTELQFIVRQFNQFRDKFNMTGFESVGECGLLLADLQLAMGELKTSGDRWNHQVLWDTFMLEWLKNKGLTLDQKHELNSWVSPLTAY